MNSDDCIKHFTKMSTHENNPLYGILAPTLHCGWKSSNQVMYVTYQIILNKNLGARPLINRKNPTLIFCPTFYLQIPGSCTSARLASCTSSTARRDRACSNVQLHLWLHTCEYRNFHKVQVIVSPRVYGICTLSAVYVLQALRNT